MSIYTMAEELRDALRALLVDTAYADVIVTLNPLDMPKAVASAGGVICVTPPTLDFTGNRAYLTATYDVWVVGGPGKVFENSLARTIDLLELIAPAVDSATATPDAWRADSTQPPAPAYRLEIEEEYKL